MKNPRLPIIAMVDSAEWRIALDQFEHITKSQWCELYYHLYQAAYGQKAATFIVDDIRQRREVIESHCAAFLGIGA